MTDPLPTNRPLAYNENMDWMEEELDTIQHLNTLSGDEYVAEAERLGYVVTDKGLFLNPDHPRLGTYSIEEGKELLERLARRHGHSLDLDANPAAS